MFFACSLLTYNERDLGVMRSIDKNNVRWRVNGLGQGYGKLVFYRGKIQSHHIEHLQ